MNSFVYLLLLLTLILSACGEAPSEGAAPQPPPPAVTVTRVATTETTRTVERVGQARAVEEVELVPRIEGFLTQRTFQEGADVEKGQLLFVIEQTPYRIEVERIQAELARARAEELRAGLDLKRIQALRKRQVASQAELDRAVSEEAAAKAAVQARQAELARARLDLSYTEIRAPFAGRIGQAAFSVGDLVKPESGALATLMMLDPIYVEWEVSEEIPLEYRRHDVQTGVHTDKSEFTPRLRFSDGSFYGQVGRIDFVDHHVDRASGTQLIRAVFPNPDKILVPGQYLTLSLAIGAPRPRLQVPQAAVQQDRSGYYVLLLDDQDQVVQRSVRLGQRQGLYWIVEDGLQEGEAVVYQGIQKIQPGSRVSPLYKTPGEAG